MVICPTILNDRRVDIDIRAISKIVYDANRFDEIPVVVVDYSMPGKDGLEVALWLRKHYPAIKILMLTGEADNVIAVKAFNDGIIDKFIGKDIDNFKDVINKAIRDLIYKYFLDLSRTVIDGFTKGADHSIITWLDDSKFLEIFCEFFEKNNIVEYYLIDDCGSFMLLTDEGKPSWLICKNKEDMRAAFELAEASDTPFPPKLLDAMKKYDKVLYLHEKNGFTVDSKEAEKALHPATKLIGSKTTYYYSYVDNSDAYNIHPENILPYQLYRKKQANS